MGCRILTDATSHSGGVLEAIKRQLLWPVSDSYFGRSGTESSFLYSMVLDLPDVDAFFR